jgi:Alcohol dehydrogenase GroES-like domain
LGEGPALPTIVGTEGFGRVLAVGRDVENVKVGDRVLAPPLSQTWREKMIVPASGLFPLPEGDPYQLSMNEAFWSINLTSANAAPLTAFIASYSSPEGLFWAKLSAASLLAVAPIMVLGWLTQKQLVQGLTFGAVK